MVEAAVDQIHSMEQEVEVQLLEPSIPSHSLLSKWLNRHLSLLDLERSEEQEQSKMLLNNTPTRQLELNGLAILSLGVASVRIGLGAKS